MQSETQAMVVAVVEIIVADITERQRYDNISISRARLTCKINIARATIFSRNVETNTRVVIDYSRTRRALCFFARRSR